MEGVICQIKLIYVLKLLISYIDDDSFFSKHVALNYISFVSAL